MVKNKPIPKKHVNYDIQYPPPSSQRPDISMAAHLYFSVHGKPPPADWTFDDAIKMIRDRRMIFVEEGRS